MTICLLAIFSQKYFEESISLSNAFVIVSVRHFNNKCISGHFLRFL